MNIDYELINNEACGDPECCGYYEEYIQSPEGNRLSLEEIVELLNKQRTKMTKQELLAKLQEINKLHDTEERHIELDDALLAYIDDQTITDEYNKTDLWYAFMRNNTLGPYEAPCLWVEARSACEKDYSSVLTCITHRCFNLGNQPYNNFDCAASPAAQRYSENNRRDT